MIDGVTVTVSRGGRNPRTGDPLPGEDHTVEGLGFDPGGSRETDALGNSVTTQPSLYGDDPDADVEADDTLLLPGDPVPWFVDGDPGRWDNPLGEERGIVIKLTRTKG